VHRTRIHLAIILCIVACVSARTWAQAPKTSSASRKPGGLDGAVLNAKGAPVAGAQILWQAADGETPHVLHSDTRGKFHVAALKPGFYDLRASASGTWSEWEHNVLVRPGTDASVTLRLTFKQPPAAKGVELKGAMHTWDSPVPGAVPHDPAVDAKGNVWFTLMETGHLARFNPDTHEWKLFKVPTDDSGPHGLVFDSAGALWFTENYAGKIGRLDPAKGTFQEFVPPTAKDPHTPVIGPDGAVWFTSQDSNVIGRLDIQTGKISEYGVPTQDSHPYGIVMADDGGLWFCELSGGKLGRVDAETGAVMEYAAPGKRVEPRRLVALKGAIYFTDSGGGRLGRLTLADKKFKMWDSPSGGSSEPYGIAADTAGKIWYEESAPAANKLVRFDPTVEGFRTYPMPAANSSVRNIARDVKGRLWMPLSLANKIAVVE